MRTKVGAIASAVAVLICVPTLVLAEGEALSQYQGLEQRIMALEDRLAASEATVAAQKDMLRAAELSGGPLGVPGSAFWNDLQIGGHVTASYVYNFNNPDFNTPSGVGPPFTGGQPNYQFNRDHHTFSIDAVKLEIGKPATQPGTAGFQVDLLWGENAGILIGGLPHNSLIIGPGFEIEDEDREASDTAFFLQEAYVSYMTNAGIRLDFGKWETLLGYELIDSPANPNITHGWLFTFAIPLFHTGLLASGSLNENVDWAVGIVNGFNNSFDVNENKGVTGRLGYSTDQFSITYNAFVGAERSRTQCCAATFEGDDNRPLQIHDIVATMSPSPNLDLWLNVDYGYEEWDSVTAAGGSVADIEDSEWYGAALGFKYAINPKTYVSMRGEWFRDDGGSRIFGNAGRDDVIPFPSGEEIDVTSATITVGHMLTQNLHARLEFRHDTIDVVGSEGAVDGFTFPNADGAFDDQQDVGLLEVSYHFD